ncbi:methyltransferase family protein [Planktosalinus lacus]|uniref:Protein-S-isoprenylcysteine O-methyltransferase n=1 Tax=Planktosalinus lacus TaxID=1526573 RepID=A0A8J2YBU6_9FLAO|nr:isoprenylcysteine carboxylmethyltransferase family protein [Planktosalinus lacus]GGD98408.1 hypothetical protein GCM10011312_22400 [Planktosalinus lacus]
MNHKDSTFVIIQLILFASYLIEIESLRFTSPKYIQSISILFILFASIILFIALIQLNINISIFPSPKKNAKLITNGVFKYSRHPIYLALFLLTFFGGIYFQSGFKIGVSVLLFLLFYFKTKYEEAKLTIVFPEYKDYSLKTKRFFPFLK